MLPATSSKACCKPVPEPQLTSANLQQGNWGERFRQFAGAFSVLILEAKLKTAVVAAFTIQRNRKTTSQNQAGFCMLLAALEIFKNPKGPDAIF